MSFQYDLHNLKVSRQSLEQIQSSQKLIHAVEIDGVLAIQKRRARNNRARMGFRNQQTEDNRNQQRNIINKIKRRQEAKEFRVQGDPNAQINARKFIQKVREMRLVEFPKLNFFNDMLRRSHSKERKGDYEFEKRSGRHSSLSKYSRERMMSVDSSELPAIKNPEKQVRLTTDRQYTRLKSLLDSYQGGRRINTME